jgi:uncharacterized protein YcbK (DUF882 family)
LAAALLMLGAGSVHDAAALNETRTLSFHHTHSNEDLTITFKRDGRYDEAALKQLNHYLRDWRTQDETVMDRHLFDILWEVYRDVDGKQPIQIISSYRSPSTNSMLRRRSAHTGVARHSQHMLGHAMDFYIPSVPLEQIRYAGLRLQRGGVGFYPTSGSPFVHLDTGNIRHWPRMTHDQLAKVFPDGRTVHVPTDGVPLKGYELARADIEKRGNGDDNGSFGKPSLFAALFKSNATTDDRTSEEDDEAPAANEKPAPAKAADKKPSDPVRTPKTRVASALQLASADVQAIQPPKAKPAQAADANKPQSVTDIINSRGFWGDDASAAQQQSTADQMAAAINARRTVESADPPATASVPAAYQAMAYAPPPSTPVVVAAAAPMPRSSRPAPSRNLTGGDEINTVAVKGTQGETSQVATSTRISAAKSDGTWTRIMMLAPSASTSLSVTVLGDPDLTQMRTYFVKPRMMIAMRFADDPTPGLAYDQFSGSAATKLETTSFVQRSASLR